MTNFFSTMLPYLIHLMIFISLDLYADCKYVSVRTNFKLGNNYQLGNQLFCVASALGYAWDHDFIPVFPFLNEKGANRIFNRDHLFFRLDPSLPRRIRKVYYDMSWSYKPIPQFKRDVLLVGPFMSWKYFHHHRKSLIEILLPSEEIQEYLKAKYKDLIVSPITVGIHVRTSDKTTHDAIPFQGLRYFEKAMRHFPEESLFVIFSDRINWCKKHFKEHFPEKNLIFIEGNNHIQDLFLLSMMKNHILSNSTFSWWGAYLHEGDSQLVCVPEIWFHPVFEAVLEDICLPEWRVIPHDCFQESYPEDMYWYDERSASVDNLSNDQ